MTQEQKYLVLKDLSARLPYGVKGLVTFHKNMTETREEVRIIDGKLYDRFAKYQNSWYDNVTIKPYLFPLSSMTEEQKEEYYSLADDVTLKRGEGSYFGIKIHCIKLGISDNPHEGVWDDVDLDAIDWLNKNHFDYRGLIEKGLAIDVTGLNIY